MQEIRDREVILGIWPLSKQRVFSTLIRSRQEHKRLMFQFKILVLFLHSRKHLSDQPGYQIGLEIFYFLSACPNKNSGDTLGLASCVFYPPNAAEISPAPPIPFRDCM